MATELASRLLVERIGHRVRHDVPLAAMTTYRVGGAAAMFVDVESLDDLAAIAEVRSETGVPVLVIGRGSNMLVADEGFAGIAVSIAGFADHIELPDGMIASHDESGHPLVVCAGGGVALPVLARRTAGAGIRGFEWAVGVPGSIGGAVRMNAGGHGSDMAASLIDVQVFDMNDPAAGLRTLAAAEIGLRFRASDLAPSQIVHEARLRLRTGDRAAAEDEISEIVRWRRENQPGGQNCGSVFVNPVPGEVTAGGLIDGLGLRGLTIGTASVSDKHANFVQATDGGRAADVRAVIEHVRGVVARETGYRLRSEVRLVGFDDTDPLSFDETSVCDV
ncbi:UDP-N-acetylmuramate dehydrogenase [Ilumatobacter sp.]|uniref:UDP-N-acetylmuramate dehydrogenase n=1 Tax=Ilumatobacter sp. TaxID=1967498 RepID=UPI003AF927A6